MNFARKLRELYVGFNASPARESGGTPEFLTEPILNPTQVYNKYENTWDLCQTTLCYDLVLMSYGNNPNRAQAGL